MVTTIQISDDLIQKLKMMKISDKESYESVIWDLIEDSMEISEQTKRSLEEARKEVLKGNVHKWEDVKRELKLKCMK